MRLAKLLALVALLAFGAFTFGSPRAAQANLSGLSVSAPTATIGQQVTVTASLTSISSATVTLAATNTVFLSGTVSSGEAATGVGTAALAFTALPATNNSTLTALVACQTVGTVTITLQQNPVPSAGPAVLSASIACSAAAGTTLTVTPISQATSLPVTITGNCALAGQLVTAVGKGAFSTFPSLGNMTVVSPTTASCVAAGAFSVSYVCSLDGIVTFNMAGSSATLTCNGGANPYTPTGQFCPLYNAVAPYTGGVPYAGAAPYSGSPFSFGYDGAMSPFNGNPYAYGYNGVAPYNGVGVPPYGVAPYNGVVGGYYPGGPAPFNSCPPNPATQIVASVSSPSVSCAGTALVNAEIRDGGGLLVVNGQPVTLTTNLGTISPASPTTLSGHIQATYTAPATGSGTATITIADGTATATATINVNCTASAVQPAPATAPSPGPAGYPVMLPPNTGEVGQLNGVRILPPNTGDAGLKLGALEE